MIDALIYGGAAAAGAVAMRVWDTWGDNRGKLIVELRAEIRKLHEEIGTLESQVVALGQQVAYFQASADNRAASEAALRAFLATAAKEIGLDVPEVLRRPMDVG